jgi:hypothetical protein
MATTSGGEIAASNFHYDARGVILASDFGVVSCLDFGVNWIRQCIIGHQCILFKFTLFGQMW